MNTKRLSSAAGVLATVLALAGTTGCSLGIPQAQTDPTRFYVLSIPLGAGAPPAAAAGAPSIRIRPVEIATYLRGRPMVVRRGANEVEFREFARWGEPLEQGIARVLREELLARGAAGTVESGMIRPSEAGDLSYALTVRVLACEGDADGRVNFEAAWELTTAGANPTVVSRGDFHPTDLRWTPRHEASLAAALSHAVTALADEVAAAVPKKS